MKSIVELAKAKRIKIDEAFAKAKASDVLATELGKIKKDLPAVATAALTKYETNKERKPK